MVACLFQRRAIFHDPALDGRVVDDDTAFLHQLFNLTIAQGIGHVPSYPEQNDLMGKWAPLKLIAIGFLPLSSRWTVEGDRTSDHLK